MIYEKLWIAWTNFSIWIFDNDKFLPIETHSLHFSQTVIALGFWLWEEVFGKEGDESASVEDELKKIMHIMMRFNVIIDAGLESDYNTSFGDLYVLKEAMWNWDWNDFCGIVEMLGMIGSYKIEDESVVGD